MPGAARVPSQMWTKRPCSTSCARDKPATRLQSRHAPAPAATPRWPRSAPRFVQLQLQPDLLGGWTCCANRPDRRRSTLKREQYPTRPVPWRARESARDAQLKRGFQLMFAQGADKNDRFLRACAANPWTAPRLADAPGRPLPAGVPRHPRPGRQLPGHVQEPGAGLRGHPAAAGALRRWTPRSCSPTSSPCPTRWAWACISSRRRPEVRAPAAQPAEIARLAVPDMEPSCAT
jgi:hypothetical protein